jgi:hypothetical protein
MIRLHPRADRILVAIFLVALCLPLAGMLLNLDEADPSAENRPLASWPRVQPDMASLRALPDQLTRYFEDHFAFRQRLVRWQARLRLKALRVSPANAVIRGRDGWLFYADDGAIEDYATAPPFTDAELDLWRRTLQDTRDWLHSQGIAYLFVISPDKHAIYPEYMPATIRRAAVSRIDQLVAHLRDRSTVRVLDLRPALVAAKSQERLYHRTDTHWNDRGAFVGYRQIVEALATDIPALRTPARRTFEPHIVRTEGLDLAGMLGLTSVLHEEDLVLVPRPPATARIVEPEHPNRRLMHPRIVTETPHRGPRAVVFMDSFGAGLVPFLSEDFSRVVYLWQNNMDPLIVQHERPHVVIQEWVGRRLATALPYNPVPDMSARARGPSERQPSPASRAPETRRE